MSNLIEEFEIDEVIPKEKAHNTPVNKEIQPNFVNIWHAIKHLNILKAEIVSSWTKPAYPGKAESPNISKSKNYLKTTKSKEMSATSNLHNGAQKHSRNRSEGNDSLLY